MPEWFEGMNGVVWVSFGGPFFPTAMAPSFCRALYGPAVENDNG